MYKFSKLKKLIFSFNIICNDLDDFNHDIAKHIKGEFLDIGCGLKNPLFKNKVKKYTGLNYAPTLKINKQYRHSEVDVYGSAEKLPFKNNSFDSAVCLSVYEHLPNPQKAAFEAYRVLKKNGIYAVTVPFMNRIHMAPDDYYRFTEYGIRHILESAGFKIIKIVDGGGMWKMMGARLAGYFYSDIMGLGYGENDRNHKKRHLYLIPILIPLIVIIVLLARILDKIHCIKKDTLHYYVLCKKTK